MKLNLTLPWPPSVNHYKKVGGLVKTKSGKIYQKRVNTSKTLAYYYNVYSIYKSLIAKEGTKFHYGKDISLEVYVYLYPPDKRKRDIDNLLKVLLDSLVRAKIIYDDSQIRKLSIEKMISVPPGEVKVNIQSEMFHAEHAILI
jgi:crossover junction endodeoxyribonuclease RusA